MLMTAPERLILKNQIAIMSAIDQLERALQNNLVIARSQRVGAELLIADGIKTTHAALNAARIMGEK